jgi:hypothetical protein
MVRLRYRILFEIDGGVVNGSGIAPGDVVVLSISMKLL